MEKEDRRVLSVSFAFEYWFVVACSRVCKQEKGEVTGGRVRSERKQQTPRLLKTAPLSSSSPRLGADARVLAMQSSLSCSWLWSNEREGTRRQGTTLGGPALPRSGILCFRLR